MNSYLFYHLYFLFAISIFLSLEATKSLPLCHKHERLALLQFCQSFTVNCTLSSKPFSGWLDLSTWTYKPDFNSIPTYPTVLSWGMRHDNNASNEDECHCEWDGVECDINTGHVVALDLSSSCLFGSFPTNTSLFRLVHLQKLSLANNHFNFSNIPIGFGSHLSSLTVLNLSFSTFSGQIPSDFSRLFRLTSLDLSYNLDALDDAKPLLQLHYHSSNLESLVGNMSDLQVLSLDMVEMSSVVPRILGNLTSLRSISMSYGQLHGNFPPEIFHLPQLETLVMSHNDNLKGSLLEFPHNSPLRSLDLSWTSFSGNLPLSIGWLSSLSNLHLAGCNFTGAIPAALGNLTNLKSLVLFQNTFTGKIPQDFANLTKLTAFTISDNHISVDQQLFSWVSKLDKLIQLGLGNTNIKGKVPTAIANLTGLKVLSFEGNRLSGPLPPWLGNLTNLGSFVADYNLLTGPLPVTFSDLSALEIVRFSYNQDLQINFDMILKLRKLQLLDFSGTKIKLPSKATVANSTRAKTGYPQISILKFNSCNLTEFPLFLRGQFRLQEIHLNHNKIQGQIPLWLLNNNVGTLRVVALSSNSITGFERPHLWFQRSHLTAVFLDNNLLNGPLVFPSRNIKVFLAFNNKLSGPLPGYICSLVSLTFVDVSNNNMSGKLPDCMGDFGGSLIAINLRGNSFNGLIPKSYSKSCKLKMINLSENQLRGKLPRSLANCNQLQVLDIGKNRIEDTFPSWLGPLPMLQILVLRCNNFYGPIKSPNFTLEFSKLQVIDISQNSHEGLLPLDNILIWDVMRATDNVDHSSNTSEAMITASDINNWVGLGNYGPSSDYRYSITVTNKGNEMLFSKVLNVFRAIDLSSNNFQGRIPDNVGCLLGLQALNLSNNNIQGGIPSSLGDIKDLESLDISSNQLTGEIPQELKWVTALEVFDVSNNQLTGPIPQGNQFNTFDSSAFEGNLGLCGNPLPKSCGIDHGDGLTALSPPTLGGDEEDDDESYFDWIEWIIVSLGFTSGVIVGYVIGKIVTDSKHDWFVEKLRHFQ